MTRQATNLSSSHTRDLRRTSALPTPDVDPVIRSLYQRPLKATRAGALFGAFPYPTKISPEAIAIFIAAHTKPGDTVLDIFAGSGTTGLAAILCERPTAEMMSEAAKLGLTPVWGPRNAVLYELSGLGAFISHTLTHPPVPSEFKEAAEAILSDVEQELRHLYAAEAPDGEPGVVRYIIWSDVLRCPSCGKKTTLWDACVSRRPAKIGTTFTCPNCRRSAPLEFVERMTSEQTDPVLGGKRQLRLREPVWVYGTSGGKNWSRAAHKGDLLAAKRALKELIPACVPNVSIPWGDLYRSGYHTGITHVHHFYTRRNLVVFGRLWDRTLSYDGQLGDALRFWLLSYNASHATIMTRVVAKAGEDDLVVTSGQPGVLYVSGLPVEKNLFSGLRRKLKTITDAFTITHNSRADVRVVQASSTKIDLPSGSVDYVFTDPPFGGNIPYAEVNFINEAWLGRYTDRKEEAIVSPAQGKSLEDYKQLLTASLSEARRVLKDNGQATLVFHSASASVWNALQSAYTDAGFSVRHAGILNKTQGSFKQVTTSGAVRGDPVLLLEKVSSRSNGQPVNVWAVAHQLRSAALTSEDPSERTPERLYSRLVAYYLTRGQRVPISAEIFYRWHREQCSREIGMQSVQVRELIRAQARQYEQSLPQDRRKKFGQFFTGLQLGKVLAHLAIGENTRTVLDPMAGHGDLLDATTEAAAEKGLRLDRLDGIEIDPETARLARRRLKELNADEQGPLIQIVEGDAFSPSSIAALGCNAYDLVITNPPYVRYQSRISRPEKDRVRAGLQTIVEDILSQPAAAIWKELVRGYSGLADLSVPAWLLAAALVKPGGRLALVVPATWRSRNYADVVRYLLLRCFEVEVVVEDKQPGWFSDALVRTHLIVAKRLDDARVAIPMGSRPRLQSAPWVQIEPKAASEVSLVGAAFTGEHPELQLARWLRSTERDRRNGLTIHWFDGSREWAALQELGRTKTWMKTLEKLDTDSASTCRTAAPASALPAALYELLPKQSRALEFLTLRQIGIEVGQGLRTGCNAFFYVTAIEPRPNGHVLVETDDLFGPRRMVLPAEILKPVLRRQSELRVFAQDITPNGRVLDLRGWALPEDIHVGSKHGQTPDLFGETNYRIVPPDLADFIRLASQTRLKGSSDAPLIPDLSAVRTNVRIGSSGRRERFWYMLPDFAPRHQPAAFIPRIIQDVPWVEANAPEPFLVDANFSTFCSPSGNWSGAAIKALLNSSWCRAYMELSGTPMGGGALKLEAAHIRRILLPPLPKDATSRLHLIGMSLNGSLHANMQAVNEIVLGAFGEGDSRTIQRLANALEELAEALSAARQRRRP